MRILSVRQPWATLIVDGAKDVENRMWRTDYRGPLLIHAGRSVDKGAMARLDEGPPLDTGGIIGICRLVDCVRDSPSEWAVPGAWHWVLEDRRMLPFAPMRGQLRLWEPDTDVLWRIMSTSNLLT